MKIGIAADHKGYVIKEMMQSILVSLGHELTDYGAHDHDEWDDYTDFVVPLAMALQRRELERGIAIIGNASGAAIIANKIKGVRAAVIGDHFYAHQAVEENDMNLLCLQAGTINYLTARELAQLFLDARFESAEKNRRRLNKVFALEKINSHFK